MRRHSGGTFGFERSYRDTIPIKDVFTNYKPQKTKLINTVGEIEISCDMCGLIFLKHACWVKRCRYNYCSMACRNESMRINITKQCIICGKIFITTPQGWFRHVTCGRKCKSIKSVPLPEKFGLIERSKNKEHKYFIGTCEVCGSEYKKEPAWEKKYKSRFCSRECRYSKNFNRQAAYA